MPSAADVAAPRPAGRRVLARVLDAGRSACEAGEVEVAERLLQLAGRLLEDRPDPVIAEPARRRGRPPRHDLSIWQEDAEAFIALCGAVWQLRRARSHPYEQAAPGLPD
jgi:hypothetical protein